MFQRASFDSSCPPENGQIRTIPELIEYNARVNPNHPFCLQAQKSTDLFAKKLELLTITHLQLKNAILRCSEWFKESIEGLELPKISSGGKITKGRPVALFIGSDVGMLFHLFALMGLGVPVILLSARLTPDAIHALLLENNATALVTSPNLSSTAQKALSIFDATGSVPSLHINCTYEFFLADTSTSEGISICCPGSYVSDSDRQVLILHSSGTTGLPKSISNSHRYLLGYSTCSDFTNEDQAQGLNITTLPLYHGWGLVPICVSLRIGKAICLPIPSTIPTGRSTLELLEISEARSLMTVPSTLEDVYELPKNEGLEILRNLDFVACGGGPLKPSVAEALAAFGVKIVNSYGITEVGPISVLFAPSPGHDWHFFRLRPDINADIVPIPRSQTNELERCRLVIKPAGWDITFEPGDEFFRNPKNPNKELRPAGRTDDLIILANGQKVSPGAMEIMLSERDDVKAALAFGDGCLQIGLIIEPAASIHLDSHKAFVNAIWPSIIQAGGKMERHAQISERDAIIVLEPGKKFPRSDKGAVLRRETYQLFAEDIKHAYTLLSNSKVENILDLSDITALQDSMKVLIHSYLGWDDFDITADFNRDLFELGMTSLHATGLRRSLFAALSATESSDYAQKRIPQDFVYAYPTIYKMASQLLGKDNSQKTISREDNIDYFIQKYAGNFRTREPQSAHQGGPQSVVLLTGSTGSLGGHLLSHMAARDDIKSIICLIRKTDQDPQERQARALKDKNIELSAAAFSKVVVFAVDASQTSLGLPSEDYSRLREQVTHIVHAAWPMDFKRGVASFESQFQTLFNLLNLAQEISSCRPDIIPRFLFISSISVVGKYPAQYGRRSVPEEPMQDSQCTLSFGYAEAKLICEKMIEKASETFGDTVESMIIRIGQISGAQKSGYWSIQEHIPALLKSSETIGAFPALGGTAAWLPVDSAATCLSELLLIRSSPKRLIYHLENPVRQSWHDLLLSLSRDFKSILSIPFSEWIEQVGALPEEENGKNPAKALLQFFAADFQHMDCGGVVLDMDSTLFACPSLRDMGSVSDEVLEAYVNRWKSARFLS